jgi:molybdate transport system ATP-binding protein
VITFDAQVSRGAFAAHYRGELGPFAVIGGPSGAGKSTLLDLIAGLAPMQGSVSLDGKPLHPLAPEQRGIGYAFQDDRLFPHLSVEKNLTFSGRRARFTEVVDALALGPLLARRPRDLSGGEKKRVGIGRAVLTAERLLLLDEPLSPLDAELRARTADLIREAAKTLPIIVVSHEPIDGPHVEIGSLINGAR